MTKNKVRNNNNYAFIDGQNFFKGLKRKKINLDFKIFREYLRQQFGITKAIVFMGYREKFQCVYDYYEECGFEISFKEVSKNHKGETKGNVDAELVLGAARILHDEYNKAIIISSDGDFACLVNYLKNVGKLVTVISPDRTNCSRLLRKAAGARMTYVTGFMNKLRDIKTKILEAQMKKHP